MNSEPKLYGGVNKRTKIVMIHVDDFIDFVASITACCANKKGKKKAERIVLQFVEELEPVENVEHLLQLANYEW